MSLQGVEPPRPMTHDLIVNLLDTWGADLEYIYVHTLANDTFYGRLVVRVDEDVIEIDSRPSDAIAVAVRVDAPIFVSEDVMEEAATVPEKSLLEEGAEGEDEDLDVFRNFLNNLDIDDLPTD
jgi:hypothetical protein